MSVYLGFDYGLKKIGVAVGDSVTASARPLKTISPDWNDLARVMQEWKPTACVVGLPLSANGGEQRVTAKARGFAAELHRRFGCPVHLCDEGYSSLAAQQDLREARAQGYKARRVRKDDEHAAAARLILQQWLSEHRETGDGRRET